MMTLTKACLSHVGHLLQDCRCQAVGTQAEMGACPQDAAAVTAELLAATGKPQSLAPTYQSAAVDTEFHQKDGCALPTANPGRDKYSALSRTSQRSAEFHGLISSQVCLLLSMSGTIAWIIAWLTAC